MMAASTLRNIQQNLAALDKVQRELSSAKRITQPSDDPLGADLALAHRAVLAANSGYLRTIDSALSWTAASDGALGSAVDVMQRAQELAIQGANEVLASNELAAIADEVDALLNQLVALGNSQLRGERLFAGLRVDADPMLLVPGPPASVTYTGDSGAMIRQIDDQQTVTINVPGTAFAGAYSALISLRDHLRTADTAAIRSADLAGLATGLDGILDARTTIGATVNQLDAARDRLELGRVNTQDRLSKLEDADLAEAASRFARLETVYQAGLAAAARSSQPNLFDYLR
jgi:flagellar hook-associated protein 3 FlgL